MDKKIDMDIDIALEIYQKTLHPDLENVKFEDIPKKIEELLSKCLNKKVNVEGNGLTQNLTVNVSK